MPENTVLLYFFHGDGGRIGDGENRQEREQGRHAKDKMNAGKI
jgi:hypothetical protein